MRPALYHRPSRPAAEKPQPSPAPSSIAAHGAISGVGAAEIALQIAKARRDARRHPVRAAMLLRSWMSDHD